MTDYDVCGSHTHAILLYVIELNNPLVPQSDLKPPQDLIRPKGVFIGMRKK